MVTGLAVGRQKNMVMLAVQATATPLTNLRGNVKYGANSRKEEPRTERLDPSGRVHEQTSCC